MLATPPLTPSTPTSPTTRNAARRTQLIAERELLLQRCEHLQREIEARRVLPFNYLTESFAGVQSHFLSKGESHDSLDENETTANSPPSVLQVEQENRVSRSPDIVAVDRDTQRLDCSALIIAMVGLPGRGKSFISTRLCRWLLWKGIPAACFNAGAYRRREMGADSTSHQEFFDPNDPRGVSAREDMARLACEDLVCFLSRNAGGVGILDATNTTRTRRQKLIAYFAGIGRVLFVESVCTDASIIHTNILRSKCGNDDYVHVDSHYVLQDFYSRISQYEKVYESLSSVTEDKMTFIKMTNVKTDVVLHRITGHLQSMVCNFLLNLHLSDHPVFLTRSGWSNEGEEGRMGHDGDLNDDGLRFAIAVKRFLDAKLNDRPRVSVMCSPMRRATQTAYVFQGGLDSEQYTVQEYQSLAEMNYGDFKGKTRSQCARENPKNYERITKDPYLYCYPRGEGYRALTKRLDPIFMELQRIEEPTIVISHCAVLQVLRAYLMNGSPEVAHQTAVPLGCVIEVTQCKNSFITTCHDLIPMMAEVSAEEVAELRQKTKLDGY